MITATDIRSEIASTTILTNLSRAELVEQALTRNEGVLAANGALMCLTGPYTGRSPNDKFLVEDNPDANDSIWWGTVNRDISRASFNTLLTRALAHMKSRPEVFEFRGFAGADPDYRLSVQVLTEKAWHSLFAQTLFIRPTEEELAAFSPDWTIVNACEMQVDDWKELGLSSNVGILQSLELKIVLIFGTHYAGEIKKSIFYAMNYDMPDAGVFPMHCSANVDLKDSSNVALFFGLSGTGKTTLSADPERALIGDDEHGWSDAGVFNFEGGCYAKCIKLSEEGEPQIWNAIRFGSVLENVVLNERRQPDYDDGQYTENTRVTYPVDFIPNAQIPSVGGQPRNVIFLTADAFGVLPPVSKLTRQQAMYYFVNGYTSKLAGTERGVTEPQPSFSPCFGGPFLPRPPKVYADMLAERIDQHGADVWLLNTGWSGGPYGVGSRFKLAYTRAMVTAILDGSLSKAEYKQDPIFGLHIPTAVHGVPTEVLNPRDTWADKAAYDAKARDLAQRFSDNSKKFELAPDVEAAGPTV
ncbi:MAG: phosphoenolpyruvate carboxykinase (ATP) [Planctomycetes bacterium]|nr:phosphoenolpyruvate carboxykinase (ATP) [Planctomycetota bacterium]NOG54189.1 phosphoenolpyruvate carboxykinase (ATP) [Planctomycetota bacterium]